LKNKALVHGYIHFDEELCSGCADCVRVCPTKAIRIKEGRSIRIVRQCIGCGECIQLCPTGAVTSDTINQEKLAKDQAAVAIVSPVLYLQFPEAMPNEVQEGLRQMGFTHVLDLSLYLEMFQYAAEEFIIRNRETQEAPWPLISPVCPLVIRLIAFRFPNLLPHVLPLKRPVALMAPEIKQHALLEDQNALDNAMLYHITPCPAKIVSNRSFFLQERPYLDKVIGINDLYPELSRRIEKIREANLIPFSRERLSTTTGGRDLIWGTSGGEISGMRVERALAVSGLKTTIDYLEKIELGAFRDIEYIELRTCREGCVGGPLTAIDRFLAKSRAHKMVKMFGYVRHLPREKVHQLYEKDWFFSETNPAKLTALFGEPIKPLSLEALGKVEEILESIQGMDCAACGAPDCRTFAEDVVMGKAELKDCMVYGARRKANKKKKKE
jgi:iron only hydrogenase large subunit-like protein